MDRLELPHAVVRGPLVEFSTHTALVRLPMGGAVLMDSTGMVAVDVAADGDHADVVAALAAPAAGAAALLAGRFALRASGVSLNCGGTRGMVIGAVAAGGASTATAALVALMGRGHHVLSDGVTVIHGSPLMVTAHGGEVDLWPDSVAAVGLRATDGVVIRKGLAKRRFTLAAAVRAVPLATVVQLDLVNHDADPVSHVMGGAEAVNVVMALMWHRWALAGLGKEAGALAWAVQVAQAVAVTQVVVSRRTDLSTVAEFIEQVVA